MKCEEFEFECTVAPNEIAGDACEHLQTCQSCQTFAEQEKGFEHTLAAAIQGDVPEGFRHSVRSYVVNNSATFWSLPKASLALAASLIMAVGLVNLSGKPSADFPIDQLIVEHFAHDGDMAMKASHIVAGSSLARVSKQFGVRLTLASQISFAEKCPIGDSYGLHMVYQYKGQAITVIYMPDITLDATVPFNYAGLKGWVKPMEKGSLAVLGGATVDLPEESFAEQAIEWL